MTACKQFHDLQCMLSASYAGVGLLLDLLAVCCIVHMHSWTSRMQWHLIFSVHIAQLTQHALCMLQVSSASAAASSSNDGKAQQGRQTGASAQPAPVINPVGASSNYTNKGLVSVNHQPSAARQGQGSVAAAPSSSHSGSTACAASSDHVDRASSDLGASADDSLPAVGNASQVDHPGLSGPQENALPGYQVW